MNQKNRDIFHIGVDDTDTVQSGCTTYLATYLIEEIINKGGQIIDLPNLIRLNPDVPFKTRGNGAVAIRFDFEITKIDLLFKNLLDIIDEFTSESVDTGMILLPNVSFIPEILGISKRALYEMIPLTEVTDLIDKHDFLFYGKGQKYGLIGAMAAIGNTLIQQDFTYELLTYRSKENLGLPRKIDEEAVFISSEDTEIFNSIDFETKRILIAPHGPDPVLFGIRGETSESVLNAFKNMKTLEKIDKWMIFISNQGTGINLTENKSIENLRQYDQALVEGKLVSYPKISKGGHLLLQISDTSSMLDCMAYFPSGKLTTYLRNLIPGDRVRVGGGIKKNNGKLTMGIEQVFILDMFDASNFHNPICFKCKRTMTSLGKHKGFNCKDCKFHINLEVRSLLERNRPLIPKFMVPPPRSVRHLSKPLKRYGKEKTRRKFFIPEHTWKNL